MDSAVGLRILMLIRSMKKCPICNEEKRYSEFARRSDIKGGFSNECKKCHKTYAKNHYENNKKYYRTKADKRQKELRKIINEAKNKPCTDCKEQYNQWQLTFDHLPEFTKKFNISSAKAESVSISTLLNELAKCEVVCANCHANRTHSRLAPVV